MELAVCQSCRGQLADRGFFCPACGRQARCGNCGDLLEADAHACVMCGATLSASKLTRAADGAGRASAALNTIEFVETERRRSVRATLTDMAVAHLSDPLGDFVSTRALRSRRAMIDGQPPVEPEQLALPGVVDEAEEESSAPAVLLDPPPAPGPGSDEQRLHAIFRYEADRLRLDEPRLKQTTQADFVRRLTCLFLYAHELDGRKRVPRSDLRTVLTESGVYDGNALKSLSRNQYLLTEDDTVRLSVPGREWACGGYRSGGQSGHPHEVVAELSVAGSGG